MTDDQTQEVDAAVAAEADDTGATVVGAIGDETGTQAAGAIVTDYDYAAIVAAFADEDAAFAAYGNLLEAESTGGAVRDSSGVQRCVACCKVKIQKMTDHSTRTGVKWGAVGGLVVGIFFPPALLASAVGWGVVGGVLGKVRNEAHKSMVGASLTGGLGPNESGILALVKTGDIDAVKAAMPAATSVRSAGVDDTTAKGISDAAKQAS